MLTFELHIILVSLFSVMFVLPKIANIAKHIGLLNLPNARKAHTSPQPLVGGIGMVIAVTLTSLVLIPINGLKGYVIGMAIVFVGFLDDFRDIALFTFGDLLGLGACPKIGILVKIEKFSQNKHSHIIDIASIIF